ncbi:MAG TPA: hypothetical protein VEM59_02260 [Acidimicrobiia bacterium]|nr:hypothetical protein [Acidimicrobiia bacterium]
MPVLAFTDSLDGRLTQVSMLAAFTVALVFIARLSWRIRRLVRGDAPVSRLELWVVGGYVFVIGTLGHAVPRQPRVRVPRDRAVGSGAGARGLRRHPRLPR